MVLNKRFNLISNQIKIKRSILHPRSCFHRVLPLKWKPQLRIVSTFKGPTDFGSAIAHPMFLLVHKTKANQIGPSEVDTNRGRIARHWFIGNKQPRTTTACIQYTIGERSTKERRTTKAEEEISPKDLPILPLEIKNKNSYGRMNEEDIQTWIHTYSFYLSSLIHRLILSDLWLLANKQRKEHNNHSIST